LTTTNSLPPQQAQWHGSQDTLGSRTW